MRVTYNYTQDKDAFWFGLQWTLRSVGMVYVHGVNISSSSQLARLKTAARVLGFLSQ